MAVLSIIIILASILLIAVIFIQNPKGGGLSSDFGSATQLGGIQKTNEFIDNFTKILAVVIAICSIAMTVISTPKKTVVPQATEQSPQNGAPQQ